MSQRYCMYMYLPTSFMLFLVVVYSLHYCGRFRSNISIILLPVHAPAALPRSFLTSRDNIDDITSITNVWIRAAKVKQSLYTICLINVPKKINYNEKTPSSPALMPCSLIFLLNSTIASMMQGLTESNLARKGFSFRDESACTHPHRLKETHIHTHIHTQRLRQLKKHAHESDDFLALMNNHVCNFLQGFGFALKIMIEAYRSLHDKALQSAC